MSHKTKKQKKTEIVEEEVLKEYEEKILHSNFKLYHGFPLSERDTEKCKIYEKNLGFLKRVIFNNALKNLGYDINDSFGVGDRTIVSDIPEHVPTRGKQQAYPFPFDDKFRMKLLFAPKFKIHEVTKVGQLNNFVGINTYDSHAQYYVTEIEHKGKKHVVVLKVVVNYLNPNGDRVVSPYDYSGVNIVALLGKKCKKVMTLARLDYNKSKAGYGHQNFLDDNQNVIDFGVQNWRKWLLKGTHLHVQTQKFELLNPNCLGSGDAYSISDANLNFFDLRDKMLELFNFHDLKIKLPEDMKIVEQYKILNSKFNEENNDEKFGK